MAGVKGRSGGHNAKTQEQHRLEGTGRKDRHTGYRNPEPATGMPAKPDRLTGEAAAEWDRMVGRLEQCKTLAVVDDAILVEYCELHALTHRLQGEIDELPALFFEKTSVDGAGVEHVEPKVHPGVGQLRQARMAKRTLLVEFGLTPASRGRVKIPEQPGEPDPFAEFDKPSEVH